MASRPRFVLDTSAILALRSGETGARRVEALLRSAHSGRAKVYLPFMTRMELLYRIARDEGQEQAESALRLIDATGAQLVSCEQDILEEAARLKAVGGLSVADAWIAATALAREAVLVHKDPELGKSADWHHG